MRTRRNRSRAMATLAASLALCASLVACAGDDSTGGAPPSGPPVQPKPWPYVDSGPIAELFAGDLARAVDGSMWQLGYHPHRLPELDGVTSISTSDCLAIFGPPCGAQCVAMRDGTVRCDGADDGARLGFLASMECTYDCSGLSWTKKTCPYACEPSLRTVPGIVGATSVIVDAGPCALLSDGSITCWHGVAADGTAGRTPLALPGGPARKLAASSFGGACALMVSGELQCFQESIDGIEDTAPCSGRDCPLRFALAGITDAIDLDITLDHGCVVRRSGRAVCWGVSEDGALGTGLSATTHFASGAGEVTSPMSFTAISVSVGMTCAVTSDGGGACWGAFAARGGDGVVDCHGSACRPLPVAIPGLTNVVQIVPGSEAYAVARRGDGSVVVVSDGSAGFRVDGVN